LNVGLTEEETDGYPDDNFDGLWEGSRDGDEDGSNEEKEGCVEGAFDGLWDGSTEVDEEDSGEGLSEFSVVEGERVTGGNDDGYPDGTDVG